MSAVATADAVHASDAVAVHLVASATSTYEMHAAEQKRWMIWFGIPALIASIFVGTAIGSGDAWWIGLAIAAIVVDIFVLVWLAMSSDTNGVIGEPAHGH
jgi:hypothetical protein